VGVEMFGQEGAREVVSQHASENAEEIAYALFQAARDYARGHLRDDVAIVVVKNGR
jgi:serine phosphatase RsbU (regulator of sigma subunit)